MGSFLRKDRSFTFSLVILTFCLLGWNYGYCADLIDVGAHEYPSEKFSLNNGLTVILTKNPRIPFVAVEALVNVGSSLEGEYSSSGISHFVEHLLFKGTKKRPVGKIENEIRSYGAQINGFTSFDYTGYTINSPKKNLSNVLELLQDALTNSTFEKSEFDKEKQVILREMDMVYDYPQRQLNRLLYKNFYLKHTYRYPVIGEREVFSSLKREDIVNFYKNHYVPNNMILAISGDIDIDEAKNLVTSIFGKMQRGIAHPVIVPSEPVQLKQRYVVEEYKGNLTYIMLGFHSVQVLDQNLFALDLLSSILGGGKSSRLFKLLYDREKLVFNISSYNYTPRYPGVFAINVVAKKDKEDDILKAIFDEIERLKTSKVSQDELNTAKNGLISSYLSSLETIQSQVADFATSQALTGDFKFSKHYVEKIKEVTIDDIQNVARHYLNKRSSTVAMLVPEGSSSKVEGVKKDEGFTEDMGIVTLQNGLRVAYNVRKGIPKVAVTVTLRGGLLAENESNNGISNLISSMLLKGTKSKDHETIYKIIESKGGSIGTFSGNNSFGITAEVFNENIDETLYLILELLTESIFPDEELEKERALINAKILRRDEDIFSSNMLLLRKLLFKNHPYEHDTLGTKSSIESLDKDTLRKFYKGYVTSNNVVVSITGNFDKEKTLKLMQERFAKLSKKEIVLSNKKANKIEQIVSNSQVLPKKETVVMIGYKAPSITHKDRYVFEIIESVLSGMDGRLFGVIRQKRGLSYTQGASYIPLLKDGYFVLYASCKKNDLDLVKSLILKEIKVLKKSGIGEDELEILKNKLSSKHWLALQTNSGLSFTMSLYELYGLGYDYYKSYQAMLDSVTTQDVERVLNDYFSLDSYVISTTFPLDEEKY